MWNTTTDQFTNKRKLFLQAFFALGFLLGLLVLSWVWSSSYITVVIENGATETRSTVLIKEAGGKLTRTASVDGSDYKIRVPRGEYSVLVTADTLSYYGFVSAKGFLRNTTVKASLVQEGSREFVGNGLRTCADYTDGLLVSWQCGGQLSTMVIHTKASGLMSTMAIAAAKNLDGVVEGVFQWQGRRYLLLHQSEKTGRFHKLYLFNDSGFVEGVSTLTLSSLDVNSRYGVVPYDKGFFTYPEQGSEAFYYASMDNNPQKLDIPKSEKDGLRLYSVQKANEQLYGVFNQSYGTSYPESIQTNPGAIISSVVSEEEDEDIKNDRNPLDVTEVIKISGEGVGSGSALNTAAQQATRCASEFICSLSGDVFAVYAEGGSKKLYSLAGIRHLESMNSEVLVVDDYGVLVLSADQRKGHYVYSFADYVFCGLRVVSDSNFMLCVNDGRVRHSLLLSTSVSVEAEIDKIVFSLGDSSDIKSISAYGSFIHIVQNAGQPTRNFNTGFIEYDPIRVSAANARINAEIEKLGLDTNTYDVNFVIK